MKRRAPTAKTQQDHPGPQCLPCPIVLSNHGQLHSDSKLRRQQVTCLAFIFLSLPCFSCYTKYVMWGVSSVVKLLWTTASATNFFLCFCTVISCLCLFLIFFWCLTSQTGVDDDTFPRAYAKARGWVSLPSRVSLPPPSEGSTSHSLTEPESNDGKSGCNAY